MPDSSAIEELPPLSDQDINILFQIVSDAQQSQNPPFKALFAAYDKVLADHGIAPEHDERIFRYLLRLGEGRSHNSRSLMYKLRQLLAKLDIHIVVQDEQDAAEDVEINLSPDNVRPTQEIGQSSATRSRRASFNDTRLDESWVSGGRLDAARSEHSPHTSLDDLSRMRKPSTHGPPVTNGASTRGGVAAQYQAQTRRSHSVTTQDSIRATRPPAPEPWPRHQPSVDYQNVVTDDETESDIPSSPPVLPPNHQFAPQHIEPIEAELTYEAEAFFHTSQIKTARRCLHQLSLESSRLQHMARIAQNHDQRLLKTQAFSIWASMLLDKRQAAETEQFFDQYERRATRARDLFLLNKAFTHWAQSTSDEVARTSVARRHILRTRYFNAWRDITAVNDLKCRRLGLRKWFSVWRTNAARKAVDNERAVAIYEENLVQRIWWKWFWAFCERKAPVWHDHRAKQSCLHSLTGAVTRLRQHEAAASQMRNTNLLKKSFGALVARQTAIHSLHRNAEELHRANLVNSCFHHLQIGDASSKMHGRIGTIICELVHLLRRSMTESYLRTSTSGSYSLDLHSSDVSRTTDCKNRFHLEEAAMIFKEHKRRRMLASVMLKFHGISRAEEVMERQALEFRNTHVMNAVLPVWIQRAKHLMKLDRWSNDAKYYCLANGAIRKWKDATSQAQRNKRRDAYVQIRSRVKSRMVRDCFAAWRERATVATQLDATAVEHANNRHINAGTAIFNLWRDKTRQNNQLSIQAEEFSARLLFLRTIAILVSKGQEVLLHHTQALTLRSQTIDLLATGTLKRLKWALFCHRRNLDSAAALEQRNSQQHRRNMLRYWAEQASRRRAAKTLPLPLDSRQDDVPESPTKAPSPATAPTPVPVPLPPSSNLFSSLRLPSARKTPAPLSAQSRLAPLLDGDEEESDVEDMDFGATHRAEEWTSFDVLKDVINRPQPQQPLYQSQSQAQQRFDSVVTSTPIPGYMARTPSKRTQRAKALSAIPSINPTHREVVVSTTPAPTRSNDNVQTPQVTPFERKMRKGGYGSSMGSGGGVDLAEESFTPATFRRTRFGGAPNFGGVNGNAAQQTGRSVRFFDVGEVKEDPDDASHGFRACTIDLDHMVETSRTSISTWRAN
ncbi:Sfi1-domain-containing protein, partial [Aureobasidium melanogenum]